MNSLRMMFFTVSASLIAGSAAAGDHGDTGALNRGDPSVTRRTLRNAIVPFAPRDGENREYSCGLRG